MPAGTEVTTGTTIESAPYNAFLADLVQDLNAARPIAAGGTGATSASAARTALGLGALALLAEVTFAALAEALVVLESEGIGSNDNDTTLPTSAAVKDYADTAAASAASGKAAQSQTFDEHVYIETPVDGDYDIIVNSTFARTITAITTQAVSGTSTLTGKINTTDLGGTANSVSSSEQTQAHASANAMSAGDNLRLTISSNSDCLGISVTIRYTRTLA